MKQIIAIIRMNKINTTKQALSLAGFPSVTCRKVLGRGKKKVDYELINNLLNGSEITTPQIAEGISEGHRLVPKRQLIIVVNDDEVDEVARIIIQQNQTKSAGDGKIFVCPVEQVIRVRTGELNENAL